MTWIIWLPSRYLKFAWWILYCYSLYFSMYTTELRKYINRNWSVLIRCFDTSLIKLSFFDGFGIYLKLCNKIGSSRPYLTSAINEKKLWLITQITKTFPTESQDLTVSFLGDWGVYYLLAFGNFLCSDSKWEIISFLYSILLLAISSNLIWL